MLTIKTTLILFFQFMIHDKNTYKTLHKIFKTCSTRYTLIKTQKKNNHRLNITFTISIVFFIFRSFLCQNYIIYILARHIFKNAIYYYIRRYHIRIFFPRLSIFISGLDQILKQALFEQDVHSYLRARYFIKQFLIGCSNKGENSC